MNQCHYCPRPAQYRLVLATNQRWRTWLHLNPRSWQTCGEHRLDPISRHHAGQLHHG